MQILEPFERADGVLDRLRGDMDISATKLGSGIADSPIAVDDTLTSIGLGYMFRF